MPADVTLTDELIICTRNRPDDLARCLQALLALLDDGGGPMAVHVVDSSTDSRSRDVVAAHQNRRDWSGRLRYTVSEPGLPLQRNVGIRASGADIVHFIDDDAVPEPGYFRRIVQCFESEGSDLLGVCGQITTLPPRRPGLLARLFLLDGPEGCVLRSGCNVLVFGATRRAPVQWLSGCSMSYRREVVLREPCDESLQGYALGEDVEWSTRIARGGRLMIEPAARIAHYESPAQRWSQARRIRTEIVHRRRRVAASVCGESRLAFWWSCAGQVMIHALKAVVYRRPAALRHAVWSVQGMWLAARDRPQPRPSGARQQGARRA